MSELSHPNRPGRDTGDALLAFSQGEIGRQRAMDALGIGYGELLDRLAERRLPLPQLPRAEVDRMADVMIELLDQAGR